MQWLGVEELCYDADDDDASMRAGENSSRKISAEWEWLHYSAGGWMGGYGEPGICRVAASRAKPPESQFIPSH